MMLPVAPLRREALDIARMVPTARSSRIRLLMGVGAAANTPLNMVGAGAAPLNTSPELVALFGAAAGNDFWLVLWGFCGYIHGGPHTVAQRAALDQLHFHHRPAGGDGARERFFPVGTILGDLAPILATQSPDNMAAPTPAVNVASHHAPQWVDLPEPWEVSCSQDLFTLDTGPTAPNNENLSLIFNATIFPRDCIKTVRPYLPKGGGRDECGIARNGNGNGKTRR